MPPKIRVNLSKLSLAYLPDDIVEGFQERLESGVDWTVLEDGARHHLSRRNADIPPMSFSEALKHQLKRSILGGMVDDQCSVPLQDQLDALIPMTIWDTERFSNEEGKACFACINGVTDDLMKLAKKVVKMNDRAVLWRELHQEQTLRLSRCKITHLDEDLTKFSALKILVLCVNYLKEINIALLPKTLEFLELQSNFLTNIDMKNLPPRTAYLGLSRNLISNDFLENLISLPDHITVLDIADNDIYDLEELVHTLQPLTNIASLTLAGNPCSMASAYAPYVLSRLRGLRELDGRDLSDRPPPPEAVEVHHDDLRSTTFMFSAIRVMGAPPPPKLDKGVVGAFHVELELPLLDSRRRRFLMYREPTSLLQLQPEPEDEEPRSLCSRVNSRKLSTDHTIVDEESELSNIYDGLVPIDPRIIRNYQVFTSNRVPWAPVMSFAEPAVKILCPDLRAVRDTFRTVISVRLKYTITYTKKPTPAKGGAKAALEALDSEVVVASFRCAQRRPVWHQPYQHFVWDSSSGSADAQHAGELDLGTLRYADAGKQPKGKATSGATPEDYPDHLKCHVGFSTERLNGPH